MKELDEAKQFYFSRSRMNHNHRSKSAAMETLGNTIRLANRLKPENERLTVEAERGRVARMALALYLGGDGND